MKKHMKGGRMKSWLISAGVGAVAGAAVVALAGAPTTWTLGTSARAASEEGGYKHLDIFAETYEIVRAAYVEKVEEDKLIENALNGMLNALDPHSGYLAPKKFTDMREETSGKFGGLGIEVTLDESGLVKVVAPIDDTPADKAGVKAGDLISHIDDEPVLGLTLGQAVEKMRGEVGTDIKLGVVRKGLKEPLTITITRAVITVLPVRARVIGEVAYLRLTKFNQQTTKDLKKKLAEVVAEISKDKVKGYVLDLRNNPGGLLNEAVSVADAFLESGEIVSTRGRAANSGDRYNAKKGDLTNGAPIVVLINEGSASASEIVAGALQDHRRAVIVGVRSFGKGSVQTILRLSNGGGLRLTTARYYTPSGRSIQARGIDPDIVVKALEVKEPEASRRLRSERTLRGHLSNDTDGKKKSADKKAGERAELRKKDYQLAYALDLLDGVSAFDKLGAK